MKWWIIGGVAVAIIAYMWLSPSAKGSHVYYGPKNRRMSYNRDTGKTIQLVRVDEFKPTLYSVS